MLHPLLGTIAAGQLGGPAQDGLNALQSRAQADQRVVPTAPPRPGGVETPAARGEAARALHVLWDHRESGDAPHLSSGGHSSMAEVVAAPLPASSTVLGTL